jgi:hypothetical protein
MEYATQVDQVRLGCSRCIRSTALGVPCVPVIDESKCYAAANRELGLEVER